jgi:hypothetical protein
VAYNLKVTVTTFVAKSRIVQDLDYEPRWALGVGRSAVLLLGVRIVSYPAADFLAACLREAEADPTVSSAETSPVEVVILCRNLSKTRAGE